MAKYLLCDSNGNSSEAIALAISAGVTNADQIVATGANGLLDNSLINWVAPGAIGTLPNPNYILNGDFSINNDPKNGVSIVSSSAYFNDVWAASSGSGNGTPTISAFALGAAPILPNPPRFYLSYQQTSTSTTSPALLHRIEDARSLAGKTVTLSFWASSAANLTTRNISLTQYFGAGGSPSASVQTVLSAGVSVTPTWTLYSLTTTLPAVTGKTVGTDNNTYLELEIYLPLNSTFTFNVTNVKLEIGSIATPFDNSWRLESAEVKACERYYQVIMGSTRFFATLASQYAWSSLPFRSSMRIQPTASVVSTTAVVNATPLARPYSAAGGAFEIQAVASGDSYAAQTIALSARM